MAKRKYTDEQLEALLAEREKGTSFNRIANNVGLSSGTVQYLCLKYGADSPKMKGKASVGIERPKSYMRHGKEVRRFTNTEDLHLLELEKQGKTSYQIAKATGRRHNSVSARLMLLARNEARLAGDL